MILLKFKKTISLDQSQEDLLNLHLSLLENSSLFVDYLGLKPDHDIVSLIFAMASLDPDSTIAVRAANDYSISKTNFSVNMNPELADISNKFKGVPDIKFCHHYFSGNISDVYKNTYELANIQQTRNICTNYYALLHARSSMEFENYEHVFGFLKLFKLGKYIC